VDRYRKWYRATCFGRPVGPWRDKGDDVIRDLIARELGSIDPLYRRFFITVPGGIEQYDEPVTRDMMP
jgi:hypothetical protein